MDEIQRLAGEVAAAYLRHLKYKTGNDQVTYDGVTKQVTYEELAFALAGVAHYNAKVNPGHKDLKDPYKHLLLMIDLLRKPYQITDFGLRVIESLNMKSIHTERGVDM